MLQSGFFGILNHDQAEAMEKIANQSIILLAMIDSILNVTTMESGIAKVRADEVSLCDFIEKLQVAFPARPDGRLNFEWCYSPTLPKIRTDRTKLLYIVQNLINNAVKFTPEGRITVSFEIAAAARRHWRSRGSTRPG